MIVITTPLGAIGLLSVAYLSLLFANFSRRLSAVTKMADHYHWFWLASGLVALSAMSQTIRGIATLAPEAAWPFLLEPWFYLTSFYLPLALGVTLDLVIVWYYWGWIFRERI